MLKFITSSFLVLSFLFITLSVHTQTYICPVFPSEVNALVDANPICYGGDITLSIDEADEMQGFQYQWQKASDENGPWINIGDENGNDIEVVSGITTPEFYRCIVKCDDNDMISNVLEINLYAPPVVDAGEDLDICVGEEVILTATGADDYSWSNGVEQDVAFTPNFGMYTYVVTGTDDKGCTGTDEVTIVVHESPTIDAGDDLEICEGEEITFWASGANQMEWIDGFEQGESYQPAVGTNQYTVEGTNSYGCKNSAVLTVLVNANPDVFAGEDISLCEGGEITLLGQGATSYIWNDTIADGENLIPAVKDSIYVVVGTDDKGCSNVDTLRVDVRIKPVIEVNDTLHICIGETNKVNIDLPGGTIVWDEDTTNMITLFYDELTVDTLYIEAILNECSVFDSMFVIMHDFEEVFVGEDMEMCRSNDPIDLNGYGTPEDGIFYGIGVIDNVFDPYTSGAGSFKITYSHRTEFGCESTADFMITVDACIGIEGYNAGDFTFYPNPATNFINIEFKEAIGIEQVEIYTLSGVLLYHENGEGDYLEKMSIDISALKEGAYLLNISTNQGIITRKLIKK